MGHAASYFICVGLAGLGEVRVKDDVKVSTKKETDRQHTSNEAIMGKFYRGGYRKIIGAGYGKYHKGELSAPLPPRITLAKAYAKNSWTPSRVRLAGTIIESGGWSGIFLEVTRHLIGTNELAIKTFIDEMGVGWIGKSKYSMKMPLPICGGWFVDVGVEDGVLIARLKHLVAAAGINPNEVIVSTSSDDLPLEDVKKKQVLVVKDDSPAPKLDEDQTKFVQSDTRNARLLAPAGAGKTLTILHRCKELITRNKGNKILLVTFTRVARDELKLRISTRKEFEGLSDRVIVTTLNQYGFKLLKKKFASCRLIAENKEKKFVLGNQLRIVAKKSRPIAENIETKRWTMRNSAKILEIMDAFKSLGMDHRTIRNAEQFNLWSKEIIGGELRDLYFAQINRLIGMKILPEKEVDKIPPKKIYDLFIRFHCAGCEALKEMNYFTIEDQKYWGWLTLKDSPRVSGAVRYSHIMVDEFQDVNPIDMQFVSALVRQHQADLTIVGDDDQTIFEWRGATPAYIVNPDSCFAGVNDGGDFKTFILTRNYRSPKNIVGMSQKLIAHNKFRVKKSVLAVQKSDAHVEILNLSDFDEIAQNIIDNINDPSIHNVAIISRKKSQLIPYQIIFASQKIDFYAAEDLNVFLTDAFRVLRSLVLMKVRQQSFTASSSDLVDDIVVLVNHLKRYPLNRADAELLRSSLLAGYSATYDDLIDCLRSLDGIGKFSDFKEAATILKGFFGAPTVEEMLECVSDRFDGFKQDFQKADDDIFYADPPFAELATFSKRYGGDFEKFYNDLELTVSTLATVVHVADDSDEVSENAKEAFTSKLHLMTALRTKGKEFDAVYVLHANKGVWPINKATTETRLEAERRLFYVAVTRAKKRLYFVRTNATPSPYLREMGLLANGKEKSGKKRV